MMKPARRDVVRLMAAGAAWTLPERSARADGFQAGCAAIERALGGRLGVGVIDDGTGRRMSYRGGERFPLCSTYKLLATACVLARVDRGEERLDRRIAFGADRLMAYSPATRAHAGTDGMTVREICAAAMTLSDNTAGNLLFDCLGGPAGATRALQASGDPVTRLDRVEPDLNTAIPGDARDTTTPDAMADIVRRFVLGTALAPSSRGLLVDWLIGNTTGDRRVRAGVPSGWRVGDRTGAGAHGTAGDVAVVWPPSRAPFVVAIYVTGVTASDDARDAAFARLARDVAGQH